MSYNELKNYDGSRVVREKINSNFETLFKYMTNQLSRGKYADIDIKGWVYDEENKYYYFNVVYDFFINGSYDTFLIYKTSDDETNYELINCDMIRDTASGILKILSDVPFKGWVARL